MKNKLKELARRFHKGFNESKSANSVSGKILDIPRTKNAGIENES